MLARVRSCAVIGLEGEIIEVEVNTLQGFPGMTMLGPEDRIAQEGLSQTLPTGIYLLDQFKGVQAGNIYNLFIK